MANQDLFTETLIEDVIRSQRELVTKQQARSMGEEMRNINELPELKKVTEEAFESNGVPVKPAGEDSAKTPGSLLWKSSLMQNYVHDYLKRTRLIEPLDVGRLAVYIGVSYEELMDYLNMVYPQRKRMLLVEDY